MRTIQALAAACCVLAALPAWGETACAGASKGLSESVAVYRQSGREAFLDRLLRGGPLVEKIGQEGARRLQAIEQALGPFQGGAVLSAKSLGARACYVVAILEFANGPAFTAAMYYRTQDDTVPLSLRVEAEPDKVFSNPALLDSH